MERRRFLKLLGFTGLAAAAPRVAVAAVDAVRPAPARWMLSLFTSAGEYTYELESVVRGDTVEIQPFSIECQQTMMVERASVWSMDRGHVLRDVPLYFDRIGARQVAADDTIHITGFSVGGG